MSGDLRCYMRYGNAGQAYRVCNNDSKFTPPDKPIAKIVAMITPQEFSERIGVPYTEMSSSQKSNYHRLASGLSMREKRVEEGKQKDMNKAEYKEHIKSMKTDVKSVKENKLLYKIKQEEEKTLKNLIEREDFNLSSKKQIKQFINKEVIPEKVKELKADKGEEFIKKEVERLIGDKSMETDPDNIRRELLSLGKERAKKKDNQFSLPNGEKISMKKLSDFGLNDILSINLGLGLQKEAVSQAENLFKKLDKIAENEFIGSQGKNKRPKKLYEYKTILNRVKQGKLKEPLKKLNPEKRDALEDSNEKLRKSIMNTLITEGGKEEDIINKLSKERKENQDKFFKSAEKTFRKNITEQLKNIGITQKQLVSNASNQLETMRNKARKLNFDEKWIEKNIKVGLDKKGEVFALSENFNNDLIKARDIIENIEGIDPKLKLSRELARKK